MVGPVGRWWRLRGIIEASRRDLGWALGSWLGSPRLAWATCRVANCRRGDPLTENEDNQSPLYFRFGGLSDIGVAFFIIAISLAAYRKGEKFAWYIMWFIPAFFISSAAITMNTFTMGFESSLSLLLPITMFVILSLLGLLLPYRKFFPSTR